MHNCIIRTTIMSMIWFLWLGDNGVAKMAADLTMKEFPAVTFQSGNVTYSEALIDGRWIVTGWQIGSEKTVFSMLTPAFQIKIKPDPSNPVLMDFSEGWNWVSFQELPAGEMTKEFVVELASAIEPITIKIHTLLDDTEVLTRWLEITNKADRHWGLTELSVWSAPLWQESTTIRWGHSIRWHVPWEGWFGWERLKPGKNTYLNNKGLVWDDPYFILHNEDKGEYFFGQLAWPQNFSYTIENDGAGIRFEMGPWAINELRVLDPKETIISPPMHLGYIQGDFDQAVQTMHEHARRSVILKPPVGKEYRIQCLMPEDQPLTVYHGNDYNEANLKEYIDVIAAAGVEVLIVDGPTWAKGYGNWVAKEAWFPNGLEPIRQYARSRGILFGLYAEPEGGRGDWSQSRGYQEPQLRSCFIRCNPDYPADNFLNISKDAAAHYMETEFVGIIDRYHLDLYRHDQNGCFGGDGPVTRRAGYIENDNWRYYDNLHGILNRVHAKYPDMLLQQASGGGSRLEFGTAAHWHEHYTSDRAGYPHAQRMLAGLSVYLPPEILVTPNGMCGKPQWPDTITLLRTAYGFGCTPMLFDYLLPPKMEEFKPEDMELLQRYAKLYKEIIRPILGQTKVYHHAPISSTGGVEGGGWLAMEFTSPQKDKGWVIIIRLNENQGSAAYHFQSKGLDANATYAVTFDNLQITKDMPGKKLLTDGLEVTLNNGQYSEFVIFVCNGSD